MISWLMGTTLGHLLLATLALALVAGIALIVVANGMSAIVISIGSWLVTTKAGRIVLGIIIALGTTILLVLSAFKKGADAERAKQAARDLQHIRERTKVDEEVRTLTPAQRRDRLREWAR